MAKTNLPPYSVQILTSEYLIEGTVGGETQFDFPDHDVMVSPMHLTGAKIQSLRLKEETACYCQDYIFNKKTALAYLPQIDFNLYPLNSVLKIHKIAYQGVFHLGPYSVTGRLMISNPNVLYMEFPVFDACFTTQLSGTPLGRLTAPFAVVNGLAIHGWEARQN
jgi:hypothetical protein